MILTRLFLAYLEALENISIEVGGVYAVTQLQEFAARLDYRRHLYIGTPVVLDFTARLVNDGLFGEPLVLGT